MEFDLQLQIYIVAGLLGAVCVMLIFIMAAICGKVSKLKRQQQELRRQYTESYDNYAYSCPTIQPGEELNRRGYSMYGAYATNELPLRGPLNSNNRTFGSASRPVVHKGKPTADGTRDAANDFAAVVNSETVIVRGNEVETKIEQAGFRAEYHGLPPPPAVVTNFPPTTTADSSDSTSSLQSQRAPSQK